MSNYYYILIDLVAIAFFLSLLLTPVVRNYALRVGLVDRPDNHRKFHNDPVPRVGGVAIAIAYSLALCFYLTEPYSNMRVDMPAALQSGLKLLPAAITIFCVGLADDIWGLRPWQKLIGQSVGAVMAHYAGFGVYSIQGETLPQWLSISVTVFWLVGCSNALNLIDGMDGLAAGVGFFATMTMLVSAMTHENHELALVIAPLAGSLVGFLRYNFNPASVFLGDCGSLLIGFLLGCFGSMWSHKSATILGMTAPLMALAIPLLEVGISIVRRFIRNQPIFGADRGHIHHRLLARGFTPKRAVIILYGICGIAAVFSLLQEQVQNQAGAGGVVVVLFCAAAWIGVQNLGYDEFGAARTVIMRGHLRGMIDIQIRMQKFERDLGSANTLETIRETIRTASGEFGFEGVHLCLQGQVFALRTIANPPDWQLRIQLPGDQHVNIEGHNNSSVHPAALSLFGQTLDRVLRQKPFLMPNTPPTP